MVKNVMLEVAWKYHWKWMESDCFRKYETVFCKARNILNAILETEELFLYLLFFVTLSWNLQSAHPKINPQKSSTNHSLKLSICHITSLLSHTLIIYKICRSSQPFGFESSWFLVSKSKICHAFTNNIDFIFSQQTITVATGLDFTQ